MNWVDVRLPAATRDRSPPGLYRSSLPTSGWPSLAGALESDRSVGAVKWCRFGTGNGWEGSEAVNWVDVGYLRLRGTAALQACADHRGDKDTKLYGQVEFGCALVFFV